MTCLELERLLDEGAQDRLPAEALAHARACARCERSLARARSLERSLEAHFSSRGEEPPAGFADRVLARVVRGEARGVRWLALPDALPWWTRVPAEPAVALALGVAALLLWRGDRWLEATRSAWPALAEAPHLVREWALATGFGPALHAIGQAFAGAPGAPWTVNLGLTVGVAPLVALAGWMMWHAGERLVEVGAAATSR